VGDAKEEAWLIERARRLEALSSVTTEITRELNLDRVLDLLIRRAMESPRPVDLRIDARWLVPVPVMASSVSRKLSVLR